MNATSCYRSSNSVSLFRKEDWKHNSLQIYSRYSYKYNRKTGGCVHLVLRAAVNSRLTTTLYTRVVLLTLSAPECSELWFAFKRLKIPSKTLTIYHSYTGAEWRHNTVMPATFKAPAVQHLLRYCKKISKTSKWFEKFILRNKFKSVWGRPKVTSKYSIRSIFLFTHKLVHNESIVSYAGKLSYWIAWPWRRRRYVPSKYWKLRAQRHSSHPRRLEYPILSAIWNDFTYKHNGFPRSTTFTALHSAIRLSSTAKCHNVSSKHDLEIRTLTLA